jgi:hypothetical protein
MNKRLLKRGGSGREEKQWDGGRALWATAKAIILGSGLGGRGLKTEESGTMMDGLEDKMG